MPLLLWGAARQRRREPLGSSHMLLPFSPSSFCGGRAEQVEEEGPSLSYRYPGLPLPQSRPLLSLCCFGSLSSTSMRRFAPFFLSVLHISLGLRPREGPKRCSFYLLPFCLLISPSRAIFEQSQRSPSVSTPLSCLSLHPYDRGLLPPRQSLLKNYLTVPLSRFSLTLIDVFLTLYYYPQEREHPSGHDQGLSLAHHGPSSGLTVGR